MRRRATGRVCSGSVRPGAACPCFGWLLRSPLAFKMRVKTRISWVGFESLPEHLLFLFFLTKGRLHAVSCCFFCKARRYRCGGQLQVTGLATRRVTGSSEQGIRVVAPGESTRDVEFKMGEGFGRVSWRVCGIVRVVAMEWRVSGVGQQVFRFICFYSLSYSRAFPRS